MIAYNAPRPIDASDDVAAFDCGHPSLNAFLKQRAFKNEQRKASRSYVVTSDAGAVVGYYSLAAGAMPLSQAPGVVRRNMPDPLPVTVLGRLAVDIRHGGRGLGRGMLREAMQRTLNHSLGIGSCALIVHAIDDNAVAFYTSFAFLRFPPADERRTLWMPVSRIAATLS